MGRPHSHGSEGRAGTECYVRGWGQCPDYFLGPGIPVLNWQVVVELHVYVSGASVNLIVDYYRYRNKAG